MSFFSGVGGESERVSTDFGVVRRIRFFFGPLHELAAVVLFYFVRSVEGTTRLNKSVENSSGADRVDVWQESLKIRWRLLRGCPERVGTRSYRES